MALHADIDAFIEAQRVDRGAANRTVEAYRRDLEQFERWWTERGASEIQTEIRADDLASYLTYLHGPQEMKAASIARKTSALKQFFKFCCLERGLELNPAEQLRSAKPGRRVPGYLTIEQVTELLGAADRGLEYPGNDPARLAALRARDRAMIYLLYATGLRVSELTGLTPHQIDLEASYLRVRGKGDKERIVPFAPVAADALRSYLEQHRGALARPESNALFPGRDEQATLSRQAFWKMLKNFALAAGVPSTLSPHKLRHSFATHLMTAGMNLRSLQTLLGHSDLSTTQIYAHVTPEHLKTAHKKFHPRG